jgi:crotonobetainyl-CoA:carnitine CoA-transferase CaiB-like acyl-CoA transferase
MQRGRGRRHTPFSPADDNDVASAEVSMAGLLEGITVLEVANWVAAPSACAMLADLGAEVLNRGKRSLGVNLEHPHSQEVARRLATRADIMVTNLLPQWQERYGLRYDDVSALNPRLICVVLTGYGAAGQERDRAGFDYAAFWARSGIMGTLGEQGEPPVQQCPGMGDQTTSLALMAAIGLALYERERSGRGQRIDCSLLHTGLWVIGPDVVATLRGRQAVRRHCRQDAGNALFNFYRARDGKWLQLVMIQSERFWPGFCRALDLEHLIADPRFDSHAQRVQHRRALIALLERQFAARTRREWGERLDRERCLWAPVQTLDEVIVDPQAQANGYFATVRHPAMGAYQLVNTPMRFQRTPAGVRGPAPELGQHTELTLLDLGYTWDDIAALKAQGAII